MTLIIVTRAHYNDSQLHDSLITKCCLTMVGCLFPPVISVYVWQYNGWILVNIYRDSQLQEGDILAVNCCCSDHLLTEELMAENLSNIDSQSEILNTSIDPYHGYKK